MSVCVSVHSGPVNQSSLKWALNVNSSKTVKRTDFKFDTHVPWDSPYMTPQKFLQKVRGQGHVTPKISERYAPIAPKRLKIQTSNLTSVFIRK